MTTFDDNYQAALKAAAMTPASELAARIHTAAGTAHREHRPLIVESPRGSGAFSAIRQWARENVAVVRAPHHTVSAEGMKGTRERTIKSVRRIAGRPVESHVIKARPGEWDLAVGGILILDHASEFRGSVIESLTEKARLDPKAVFIVALIETPVAPYMQKAVDRVKHLLGKYIGKPLVVSAT